MPKFIYKAKKGLHQTVDGHIEAINRDDAVNKLTSQGLFPISISEHTTAADAGTSKTKKAKVIINKKISSKEILQFTLKLTTLIRARVELLSSLRIIYEQADNQRFREVIHEIYNATKEGKTFSDSLAKFPNIFSTLFINLIRAGEASGKLDFALEQISDFLTREDNLRTKIRVALAYPILLMLVGLSSIFILINFVIPKLKPLFEGLGKDLPLITKIILQISAFSNKTWYIIAGIIAAVILYIYFKKGTSTFINILVKIRTKLPIIKRLSRNQDLAYFSRAFGLLIKSGVPALKSLEVSIPTISDPALKDELKKVCKEVASGQTISKSAENYTSLPKFFTKMIAVGEESGTLSDVLDEIYNSYNREIEADIALITSLIEPLMILVMGVILGTIVLAILLPTFQITQMVH
ncbi:MAG: type II secretion system F family protein [Candidatus Omnitrophica bacterium]|nr:type II secretion system F family protein [Candidatus Omnitrophota bacterium]